VKREAVGTTKMKRLCKLLDVRLYVAVGIMESLWHLTAKETPQGNIGKLSNEDIALGIDWNGDPDQLVSALVKSRWIDESETHRLIVHDWHEHADDAVDVRLARAILLYANGAQPRMNRLSKEEKARLCAQYTHSKRTESAPPVPVPVPVPEELELTLLSPEATIRPEDFANTWNRSRGKLPKIEEFSESRRKKVTARIRQGISLERFEAAVQCCTEKPFLRGDNDQGWSATFDWLVGNDRNIEKAITDPYGLNSGNGQKAQQKIRILSAPGVSHA
jgi:hypothetical protein